MTVFARVAAARSFSAAARELGISQATASKHVQTLEHWLGSRLLHRTTRQVALTEAGMVFFTQCTRILEDLEIARQSGQSSGRLRGSLHVTIPVGLASIRLPRLMVRFMQQHPQLAVSVAVCDRPVDLIEEGYDVALRAWLRPPDDPALVVYPLMALPFALCASPGYVAAHGAPTVPADLARLVCLLDSRHPGNVWRFVGPDGETEVAVTGQLRVDNFLLRREAALADGGLLLAPELLVAEDIAAGRLVRLLPDHAPPATRLDAVSPVHRAATPKVRQFVAFLTDCLSDRR